MKTCNVIWLFFCLTQNIGECMFVVALTQFPFWGQPSSNTAVHDWTGNQMGLSVDNSANMAFLCSLKCFP